MKKTDIIHAPEYYSRYIELVEDEELMVVFEKSLQQIAGLDQRLLNAIGDKTYATGKWTAKQILQHITDWERIICYRVLIFARKDEAVPNCCRQQPARHPGIDRTRTRHQCGK